MSQSTPVISRSFYQSGWVYNLLQDHQISVDLLEHYRSVQMCRHHIDRVWRLIIDLKVLLSLSKPSVGLLQAARPPLFDYSPLCLSNLITQVILANNKGLLLASCLKWCAVVVSVNSPCNIVTRNQNSKATNCVQWSLSKLPLFLNVSDNVITYNYNYYSNYNSHIHNTKSNNYSETWFNHFHLVNVCFCNENTTQVLPKSNICSWHESFHFLMHPQMTSQRVQGVITHS